MQFSQRVVAIDRVGGDVWLTLTRANDGAEVHIQVSPAGSRAQVLSRTPYGDVSYTRYTGLGEREAGATARRYGVLLSSQALPLPTQYPHLLGAGATLEQLGALLDLPTTTPKNELTLDPEGLCEFLSPEIVVDGAPNAGHVLHAVHWLPERRACKLDFAVEGANVPSVSVVVGAAADMPEPFAVRGALGIELADGEATIGEDRARLASRLTAIAALKQAPRFQCTLADASPLPSVPAHRAPVEPPPGVPPVPDEFPDLDHFTTALVAIGAFRSAEDIKTAPDELAENELTQLATELRGQRERFTERMAESVRSEWSALESDNQLLEGAVRPDLEMPHDYADAVAVAAILENMVDDDERGSALDDMYLDSIPRKWLRQLTVRTQTNVDLLHTKIDWDQLPRLRRMIAALYDQTTRAGGDVVSYLGAATADDFFGAATTISELYEGSYWSRFMPLQDQSPAELAAIGRFLHGENTVEAVADRFIASPLFHDLSHGRCGRVSLFPPNLDECITAYIGVRAAPDLLLPETGEENALQAFAWYSQVGQALARTVGWEPLVRAYTGVETWSNVLTPELNRAVVRLGIEDYFHYRHESFQPRVTRPDAWLKLIFLAAASGDLELHDMASLEALEWAEIPVATASPLDQEIVADGLKAMCVHHFTTGDWLRVGRRLPPGPIEIDLSTCRIAAASHADAADPAPPTYLFPPAIAADLRSNGVEGFSIELRDTAAIPEVTSLLVEGRGKVSTAFSIHPHTKPAASAATATQR